MTPLRQLMIEAMQQRGFSPRTHQSYLGVITDLARYTRRSPAQLSGTQIERYFRHLVLERKLAPATCALHLQAVRFLYHKVLKRHELPLDIAIPNKPQRIPELLTPGEVARLLQACHNLKHRTALATCYACGLRVSELLGLRVCDIDGERHLLRIEQGKGGKDRLVLIGEQLLVQLRHYWRKRHPEHWLFPGREGEGVLCVSCSGQLILDTD